MGVKLVRSVRLEKSQEEYLTAVREWTGITPSKYVRMLIQDKERIAQLSMSDWAAQRLSLHSEPTLRQIVVGLGQMRRVEDARSVKELIRRMSKDTDQNEQTITKLLELLSAQGILEITKDKEGRAVLLSWTYLAGIVIPELVPLVNDNEIMAGSIASICSKFFGDYDDFLTFLSEKFGFGREHAQQSLDRLLSNCTTFMAFLREVAVSLGILPGSPSEVMTFRELAYRFLQLAGPVAS